MRPPANAATIRRGGSSGGGSSIGIASFMRLAIFVSIAYCAYVIAGWMQASTNLDHEGGSAVPAPLTATNDATDSAAALKTIGQDMEAAHQHEQEDETSVQQTLLQSQASVVDEHDDVQHEEHELAEAEPEEATNGVVEHVEEEVVEEEQQPPHDDVVVHDEEEQPPHDDVVVHDEEEEQPPHDDVVVHEEVEVGADESEPAGESEDVATSLEEHVVADGAASDEVAAAADEEEAPADDAETGMHTSLGDAADEAMSTKTKEARAVDDTLLSDVTAKKSEKSPPPPPFKPSWESCGSYKAAPGARSMLRMKGTLHRSWVYRIAAPGAPASSSSAGPELGYVHMPTIAWSSERNRLYVAWQGSKGAEGNNDQNIYFSSSASHGSAWTQAKRLGAKQTGARWAPVLFVAPNPPRHAVRHGKQPTQPSSLRLFYAESKNCFVCNSLACKNLMQPRLKSAVQQASTNAAPSNGYGHMGKENPTHNPAISPQWKPGGDIYVEELVSDVRFSGSPTLVLSESTPGGNIPKVIANPPAVSENGNWVLPYWREVPRGENVSPSCRTRASKEEYAGVVSTNNFGRTWHMYGSLKMKPGKLPFRQKDKPDWLIEASIVSVDKARSNNLLQLFRTSRDVAFASRSTDGGKSWSEPARTPLANPNSKLNVIRIPTTGHLVVAYNNHAFREKKRSNLVVATSRDEGKTWSELVKLETVFVDEQFYHYPSMAYVPSTGSLFVVYASFGKGIRMAKIDLECSTSA